MNARSLCGCAVLCLCLLPRVSALTANFDTLNPDLGVASGYSEGGLQFTSPNGFSPVTGYFGAVLFGWGGYTYTGNALRVINNGWVGISAPGNLMTRVSFSGGFDWSGYAIEYGLLDVTFEWQTWLAGTMTATAATTWDRNHPVHQFGGDVTTEVAFDTLLIRSTAVGYQGVFQPVPQPPGYWYYERGPVIGYGDENRIAFDTVIVQIAPIPGVPDGGTSGAMFAAVVCALFGVHRRINLVRPAQS